MSKLFNINFIVWLVLGFAFFLSQTSYALEVQDVRFGAHPDKTRMVVEIDRNVDFRAFAMADPNRLVIDLPSFNWSVGNIAKSDSDISGVRNGILQKGISRIVVDLEKPTSIINAFMLPAASGRPDRLVVDFKTVSANAFAQRKDKIFGRLSTETAGSMQKTTLNIPQAEKPLPNPESSTQNFASKPSKKPLIVIDAGHGGQDPGAVGANKAYEKTITLKTARELKSHLEKTGRYRVKLTRNSDKFLKLHQRVNIARKAEADLFMSIHADSINNPKVRGASIYTLSDKASDAQTARLAARENQADLIAGVDLTHEDKDVANILIDLTMRDTMNQSKFLANTIVETLQDKNVKLLPKPHRYAGFAVLKAPDIPSVLVEIGFMSNKREAKLLENKSHRQKIVNALANGIDDYFAKIHKNHRS